jgi:A/G-specific adenine glycosylase
MNKRLPSGRSLHAFRSGLLGWYEENQRDLPWRRQPADPYRVWISEIMLQQTRVAAVIGYFERFVARFPDVTALAAAPEQNVLAMWSGLGYYRRARMLHLAAKQIVSAGAGKLPGSSESLRQLPGIGRYTAAAIASIAFQEPVAVVDGNVERVLGRVGGQSAMTVSDSWAAATRLLAADRPGDFNQAMMELGATICVSRNPKCDACPVRKWCVTRGEHGSATTRPRKKAVLIYVLARRNGSIRLVQRHKKASLMGSMWELPALNEPTGLLLATLKHSITDTDYQVRIYRARAIKLPGRWVPLSEVNDFPLTGLARKALQAAHLL